ncbi:SH3 domain-containing protein [Sphingosinicella sp. BN140058]|uniref:SH3 domain-containing protein n=1 Tax=Sphingosinicella sp. BN140058 TaxID=1892855 RepID=UPI001FB0E613|nr:SH3 domain-containing protein [Sphingosinicella sp. BN140058]
MRKLFALGLLAVLGLSVTSAEAQKDRQTPYWASISATKAMMRSGPGRNYPATWLYLRADLPIKVVETYPNWRKVQDPAGETGWMLQNLLSDTRTALVGGSEARPMHEAPDESSPVRFRAEPGVVGRLSKCAAGWCQLDVGGRKGFIRTDHFWGVDPGENID